MMGWAGSKKPLIIAHRGFTKNHLENTLEAVDEAIRLHVDGVEVDLQMTADGELVVYHDNTLQRLADQPEKIEKMTLEETRKVRLKLKYKIPTLSELLDLAGEKILLNLEIKTIRFFSSKVERRLLELLQEFHLGETILVSSFHPFPLLRLKRMAPELKRGYLVWDKYFRVRYRSTLSALIQPFSINPGTSMITEAFVNKIHEKGQKIFTWNVNELHDMIRYVRWGVDGFFSDKPDLLLQNLFHQFE